MTVKVLLLTIVVTCCFGLPVDAAKVLADAGKKTNETKVSEKKVSKKRTSSKRHGSVDKNSESRALDLVDTHLPELKDMLGRLRSSDPREYNRAIRDLWKSARKLDAAKKRDERLFDVEVEVLKSKNQVNLLTAKLKVRDSQSDRDSLRVAAQRWQHAQVARAQYDVEAFEIRLERAKKTLEASRQRLQAMQSKIDEQVEKTYTSLLRKAGRDAIEDDKNQ